jgi:hypothetical protein
MCDNAIIPSIAVPSVGILLMLLVIFLPGQFRLWSPLFTVYAWSVIAITVQADAE